MVQLLWKMVWHVLKNLDTELPYDLAMLLPDMYPENENRDSNQYMYPHVPCGLFTQSKGR